jgi:hypothetical protein
LGCDRRSSRYPVVLSLGRHLLVTLLLYATDAR